MKKILSVALFSLLFVTAAPQVSRAADNILVVFDASGSMLEPFGGSNRIEIAKSALTDLLTSLDPSIKVALRPFADIKRSTQAEACNQTELAIPFTTDHMAVKAKVDSLQAVGSYTGTAYALRQAKNDFVVGQDNALILLTDGKETCGGDTAAAAAELLAAGIKVKTYVIGIDLDAAARAELSAVAVKGGGKYFDATDGTSLASSLKSIQAAEKPIDRTNTDALVGTAVRGGTGFDTAVDIVPGKYHLDHNQKGNDWDYFKLAVQKDVPFTVTVISSLNGVRYDSQKGIFTPSSLGGYASVQLLASDRSAIERASVVYSGKKDSETITPTSSGFIYLRVGPYAGDCVACSMSKDSTFEIQAGSAPDTAAPVGNTVQPGDTSNTPTDTSAPSASGMNLPGNMLLYIGMGMAALIVILLVVVVMMLLNKKTPPPPPPAAPQMPPTAPPAA